jgi:hypothetical protein
MKTNNEKTKRFYCLYILNVDIIFKQSDLVIFCEILSYQIKIKIAVSSITHKFYRPILFYLLILFVNFQAFNL